MKILNSSLCAAATLTIVAIGYQTTVADELKQTATMQRFEDASVIENAQANLIRMHNGIYMTVETEELTPGDAVTMWYVVFNEPGKCSEGECGEDDVFNLDADGKFIEKGDGTPPLNMAALKEIGISILRADGLIIDEDGKASFRGHLPLGDTMEAVVGPGLLDAEKAEVHAVIRSHRKSMPGMANEMVNSMNGGCDAEWPNEPCIDLQFAVFKPAM